MILLPKARPAECHPRPPNLLVSNSQRPLFLPSGPNSHSPAIRLNQPLPGRRFTDLGLVICPDPLPLRNCVCQPSHPCLSSRIRQIKACRVTRRLFLSYIKLFCAPPPPAFCSLSPICFVPFSGLFVYQFLSFGEHRLSFKRVLFCLPIRGIRLTHISGANCDISRPLPLRNSELNSVVLLIY